MVPSPIPVRVRWRRALHRAQLLSLAAVACAGASGPGAARTAPAPRSDLPRAPRSDPPRSDPPRSDPPRTELLAAPPGTSPPPAATAWARLQAYLPALAGRDHEHEFQLVDAYSAARDADSYWEQLAAELDAGRGALDRTCAASTAHVFALTIDDPATTRSIGRPGLDTRVFWMPLADVANLTVAEAIRAAGLVDGPRATALARELRRGRTLEAWLAAVEQSEGWFLPAGDDPSVHHRRIRGYAAAPLPALRPQLVYLGVNVLGGFCDLATIATPMSARFAGGAVRSGAERICELPGVRELPECRR